VTDKKGRSGPPDELREKAEEKAREKAAHAPDNPEAPPAGESRRLTHELRVHQIELEMQNEELRRAQAELEISRSRYFDLYDLAPVGYFDISEKGIIIEANLTASTQMGMARKAMIGKPLARNIFIEDQDIYYFHRRQLFETGAPQVCELRLTRADGSLFWARIDAVADNSDPAVPLCKATMTDITDRKKREAEILHVARDWQTTFDAMNDAVWILDADQRVLRSNKAAERFFNQPAEEFIGKRCWEIVHGSEEPIPECPILRARKNLQREKEELKIGEKWLEITVDPILDEKGGYAGAVHVVSDITGRKRAEVELNNREALLQKVFDVLPVGLWFADKDGKLLRGNPAGVAIWGAEPHVGIEEYGVFKARRYPSGEEIAPDDWALAHTVREGATIIDETLEIDAFDGKKKIILNSTAPVVDDSGNILGAIVVNQDITGHMRMENATRENEESLRKILRLAPIPLCFVDKEGGLQYFNERFIEIFGYTHEDIPTFSEWWRLAFPDESYRKQVMKIWDAAVKKAAAEEKDIEPVEYKVTCKNGEVRNIEISGVTIEDSFLATFIDVTERRQSEGVLSFLAQHSVSLQEKNFFELLAEYLAGSLGMDFVCIDRLEGDGLNARTLAVWCDGKFEDNVTYALKDTPCGDVVGKEVCCFPASVCQFFPKDDVLKDLKAESYIGVTLWGHSGKPIGLIAVIGRRPLANRALAEATLRTVAVRAAAELERLDSEAALRQSEDKLRQSQKMEAVGRLAGGIAHDFNNMLAVINGYAEMAIESLAPGDPLREDLEEISKAGQRSADLTRQLLAFSRRQPLAPVIMDMNVVVAGIEPMIRRLIGEDIALEINISAGLGKVKADPGQIEQVIMNLAVNSRDSMPKGGKLIIETCNVELGDEYAANNPGVTPGHYVRLSISDTGVGMDADTMEHIFEPFYTTKETGKGTGLGLSTVYGIIKQSGGNIFAYSDPGKGTMFNIDLPREFSENESAAREKTKDKLATGTETILVVEDEPSVLSLTKRVLEAAGYTVHGASNGGEAFMLCERIGDSIQLMVTDIVMPDMNGRELAERLAKICPNMKVLFMSGYTEDAIVLHGLHDHGINFISKPFSTTAMADKVREVLDG